MITEMDSSNYKNYNKPNQPFLVTGRIIPALKDGVWSYTELIYEKPYQKSYEDEAVNLSEYIGNPGKIAFFYYISGDCAGQIRLRENWNKFAFIEDIAVASAYRRKGIGTALIAEAEDWAKAKNLCGLALETQDINLNACRFYNKRGFKIGAVDTMLYSAFDTAGEIAVFWYKTFS